ncbi:E3 ubiquitin-protein ligase TRIM35-like [Festucalex cinctus]
MASQIQDNLCCPACLEIFNEPVILLCSHSFCRGCVQQWWRLKGDRTCPLCGTECTLTELPLNLALKSVCEALSQASVESEDMCRLHKKKLQFICLNHQQFACLLCRDAEIHAGHKFRPLNEFVNDHKEKLRRVLQGAKNKLDDYDAIRDNCNEQAAHIKVQVELVESKIKKDFEELHRFLQVEEEARLFAVREEEQKKSQMMKDEIEALSRDILALSDVIRSTEEQLTSDPVSFLKNFQTALTKINKLPDKPKRLSGALLDEAKHVGNLKFSVWERMKEMASFSPVILDPNTADPELSLSEDLTSVCYGKRQRCPMNPERFQSNCVLGSALAPGTHEWDVEVGNNTIWHLGVAWGDPCLPHNMHVWSIVFSDDKYKKFTNQYGSWNPPVKLQRIRVRVDTNKKSVSFTESLTKVELCKTKASDWPHLSGNMFPFFWTRDEIPLTIIPLPLQVTTQSQ